MAANVLSSPEAIKMIVYIVRAFVKQCGQMLANTAILKRLAEIEKTLMEHDQAASDIYQKLLLLLQPPAEQPNRRLGFHPDDDA